MSYYDALIAKWATLTGTTDEKLDAINSEMVDGPKQAVSVSQVTGYLATHLKLASLMAYADEPPVGADEEAVAAAKNLVALFRLPQPPAFRTDLPEVYAVVQAALAAIAGDPLSGLSSDDVAALLELADMEILWRIANGYDTPISVYDLQQAGGLK